MQFHRQLHLSTLALRTHRLSCRHLLSASLGCPASRLRYSSVPTVPSVPTSTLGAYWSSAVALAPRRRLHDAATPTWASAAAEPAAEPVPAAAEGALPAQGLAAVAAAPLAAAAEAAAAAAGGGPAPGPRSPSQQPLALEGEELQPQTRKKKAASGKSPSSLVLANQAPLAFKAQRIAELLGRLYPNPPIPLDHGSHFQLLCAVLLSAQTTDKKVNECTPALFQLAPDAPAMAAADVDVICACIRQLGLAPTKARNLKAMSQILVEQHDGQVPASMEALEALPGVGHKTASVVMCQAFGQDAFPVDTHIHRLAQRWGLTDGRSVEQTEADLKLLFPQHLWKDLHLQIIFYGRERCPAQRHDPLLCPICSWAAVPPYNKPGVSPVKAGGSRNGGGSGSGSSSSRGAAAGKAATKTAAPGGTKAAGRGPAAGQNKRGSAAGRAAAGSAGPRAAKRPRKAADLSE